MQIKFVLCEEGIKFVHKTYVGACRVKTSRLDPGFPWFFSVTELMVSRYPKSTLQCMLITQPSKILTSNFSPKRSPPSPQRDPIFCNVALQTHNSALMHNLYLLLPTPNRPILTSVPSLLPQVLPCYQSTFAPKVPGHCLGTFRAGTFSDSSSPL